MHPVAHFSEVAPQAHLIRSLYILSLNNKHIFNPAAIAVVITSFALGESASWWVGTASMQWFRTIKSERFIYPAPWTW